MPPLSLSGSVGRGGINAGADVQVVQQLLKAQGLYEARVDGDCGPRTIAAIEKFQETFLAVPDGLVEPGKGTFRRLLSATSEWQGDPKLWSQEKKFLSMNSEFRTVARQVVAALSTQGWQPKIFYGWRSLALQEKLRKAGRSKVSFSFHNAMKPDGSPNAYAADIIDARYAWETPPHSGNFFKALGAEAKQRGLHWGGDFASFPDAAHIQFFPNSHLKILKKENLS